MAKKAAATKKPVATKGKPPKPPVRAAPGKKAAKKAAARPSAKKAGKSRIPARGKKIAKKQARPRKAKETVPVKPGRPSSYNQTVADTICDRLATEESLRQICQDERMPARPTIARWRQDFAEFRSQYALAREEGVDAILDEAQQIADDASKDIISGGEFGDKPNVAAVQRARLRVEFRKWKASKLDPKRWGDKGTVEISGLDGAPVQVAAFADFTPEMEARIKEAAMIAAELVPPAFLLGRDDAVADGLTEGRLES